MLMLLLAAPNIKDTYLCRDAEDMIENIKFNSLSRQRLSARAGVSGFFYN